MFEVVVLAQFGMKNVYHHIAEIQHHPPALREPLMMPGAHADVSQLPFDVIRDGFQMRLRGTGAN